MSDDAIKYEKTMWAELNPDVYGGEECDQVIPLWRTHAEGDMEDNDESNMNLVAGIFPPGTRVVISEPLCPKCGSRREPKLKPNIADSTYIYSGPCSCGFDWDGWVLDQYS